MPNIDPLSLDNICEGAVAEVFQQLIEKLLANMKDPNTDAEAKRSITIKLIFSPLADRSGAVVVLTSEVKMPSVAAVKGSIFVNRNAKGELAAYPNNPKQLALFMEQAPERKQ